MIENVGNSSRIIIEQPSSRPELLTAPELNENTSQEYMESSELAISQILDSPVASTSAKDILKPASRPHEIPRKIHRHKANRTLKIRLPVYI